MPLSVPAPGPPFVAECIEDTDPAAVTAIQADPSGHYVNVHTESFPGGAARGQLFQIAPPAAG